MLKMINLQVNIRELAMTKYGGFVLKGIPQKLLSAVEHAKNLMVVVIVVLTNILKDR
jgi:hypothetical protein